MRKLDYSERKVTTPGYDISQSWIDWTKQLHAYTAWVNSQLRKTPGVRLVSDLRSDFRDGTAFAHLIEVVSGTKIVGIDHKPLTYQSKRQNVEKILHFLAVQNIDIHSVTVKEIIDGNLKSIMRLIQAIAKQYKPKSVSSAKKQPEYGSVDSKRVGPTAPNYRGLTVVGGNNNNSNNKYPKCEGANQPMGFHRPRTIDPMVAYKSLSWSTYKSFRGQNYSHYDDGDYAGTDSDVSGRNSPLIGVGNHRHSLTSLNERLIDGGGEVDGASCIGSPAPSVTRSPITPISRVVITPAKSLPCLNKNIDRDGYRDYENYPMLPVENHNSPNDASSPKFTNLQNKFLSGHPNESAEVRNQGTNTFGETSTEDKLVALQSYLQQTSEKCHDLHSNLQRSKQDCATLEDVKSDLQTRVVEQDKSMLEMKQELMKLSLMKQSLEAEKDELLRSLDAKEQQMVELRRQMGNKDKLVHQQKSQFDDAVRNLTTANKAKACLTARLADQDRKIALLEQARNHKTPMREELQVVRDALQSLRCSFKRNEPQHHTIDTLEQSFALLMERLHLSEMQKISNNQVDSKRLNFDSTGDPRRFPVTSYPGLCLQKLENDFSTKVVYFTEKTLTPFMSSIPKRLGEIRLQDFKTMFDRPGNYRFHFKSVDPEYGMVKEEIMQDDDILPGWDGKIIAWVEEDHG